MHLPLCQSSSDIAHLDAVFAHEQALRIEIENLDGPTGVVLRYHYSRIGRPPPDRLHPAGSAVPHSTKGRQMIRVTVDSIRVSLLTQNRVVVLRETDSTRYLPIWIGPFEAEAIAMAIQGHEPQRPLTHDLLKAMIGDLGGTISHIFVSDIRESTFYARIVIEQQGRTIEVDARPSDAVALAVRTEAPIYVEAHVLDQAGVYFDEDEQVAPQEAEAAEVEPEAEPEVNDESMSIFRDFINTLDLDNSGQGDEKQS